MALQTFTAGQVLTAAQVNALQANDYNQTVSTKVASYVLVAADKGTRVVMNSASATTITVNTSLFSAGDTLFIHNIGAGVCTITAGTATVSTAGSLALPVNAGGTLYFTSTGVSIFFPSYIATGSTPIVPIIPTSVAVASGSGSFDSVTGNVTFTAATTVSLNGVFSATYDKYIIMAKTGVTVGGVDVNLRFRVGGTDNTSSNYSTTIGRSMSNGTLAQLFSSEGSTSNGSIGGFNINNADYQAISKFEIVNPFQTAVTNGLVDYTLPSNVTTVIQRRFGALEYNATTSFDGFSLFCTSALTGTIKVMAYV